jgi:DNA-binding transcriptional LysR family regulator
MNLSLTRLRRFLAIYRARSFTRAAAELGMTHSALTKSVQMLEQELGTDLFDRTTRQVTPTAAGTRLAARGEELLAFADQIVGEAVSGKRHIRLITGPAVIEASLAPVLAAFYAAHPDIRLSVETLPPDIAIARLRGREADLLLYHSTTVSAFAAKRSLRITRIIDETYVAVLRPDHPALSASPSLDEMLAFRWAIPGYDRMYRSAIPTEIERKYRRAGFPHYRILSLTTCLALAEQSDLITILPESFARREVRGSNLTIIPTPLADGARYAVSAITLGQDGADPVLEELIGLFAKQPI